MNKLKFWLMWSWRDLKARWLQVLAIAIIIALGTGVFAGLGGQQTWREDSYDLSYGRLNMYDLKLALTGGSFVERAALLEALSDIEGIEVVEPRLITKTLVDASHNGEDILVKGEIIGVNVSEGGPHVNSIFVDEDFGRTLQDSDAGAMTAVLEYKFADYYSVEVGSEVRISGDVAVEVVGLGHAPEFFMVVPETGVFFGEANFAAVFVSLETAQDITGHEGLINDAVISVTEGADRDAVEAAIDARMAELFPETGYNLSVKEDNQVYTQLYADAEGDQGVWTMIATLFLIGAAMGAFNLAGRIVESQRRQIGILMALGVSPRMIALRPMLVGVQIAIAGTILGIVFGYGLSLAFATALESLVPLPYYKISFYMPAYVQAISLGIIIPFVATMIPVWRAVRVPPVDAIRTGHLVAKGGGLSWLLKYLPLPGRSFTQMPIKNLLRSPWRTLMTVLGIAIAVLLLVFIMGALDTYVSTMDQADEAYRHEGSERVLVNMDFFYPEDSERVEAVVNLQDEQGQPMAVATEKALRLGGTLMHGDVEIETVLELHDMETAIWRPNLLEGTLDGASPGVIISQKAADDMGVGVGDSIQLEHPIREGILSFRLVETAVTIVGIHDNPLRPFTYMDMGEAAIMGLEGNVNQIILDPAPGVSPNSIKQALITRAGVTSVEPISEFSDAVEELLALAVGMLGIIAVIVMIMSFLIAFNSTTISVDERVREIATMFAYGLPIRTVTRMQMIENFVIGIFGTIIGTLAGWQVVAALFTADIPGFEDLSFVVAIKPLTIMLAIAVGVLVVTLTPIVSVRKLRGMDIPSTLRVME